MNENTKLYNTVQVQKLEAELQFISESLTPPTIGTSDPRGEAATCNPDSGKSVLCTCIESLQLFHWL